MEKFNKTLRGYDPNEVNRFLDQIINQVEEMVNEINTKDKTIAELKKEAEQINYLTEKVEQYERMEGTLKEAILMAQKTSDQIKINAEQQSEAILNDAKRNASRIVNEALLSAEKTEREAANLRKNMKVFKHRVKNIIEAQLEVVEEIEILDF